MRLKAVLIMAILAVLAVLGLPALPTMAQTTQPQSGTSTAAPAPLPSESDSTSEAPGDFQARSSASLNITGNFQRTATGNGITDTASKAGGFFLNYRYILRPRGSIEVNGGFTTFTQYYSPGVDVVQSNVWEGTAAYVFRPGMTIKERFKPFIEGGGGILKFSIVKNGSLGAVSNAHQGAILYGGGFEWRKTPTSHISIRFGFRGLLYKVPQFGLISQQTGAWTQMAEPFAGFVWNF